MMKKLLTALISTLFLVTLISCGGGDGDSSSSTPTDPDQEFSLVGYKDLTEGEIYGTGITGSDSEGNEFEGVVFVYNTKMTLNLDLFPGVPVTDRSTSINLVFGSASIDISQREFYDESAYLLLMEVWATGMDNAMLCYPAYPYALPDSVKIGDTDTYPMFTCEDGSTQDQSWRIEDAKDGKVYFVTEAQAKDEFGSLVSTTEFKFTINSESELLGFKGTITDVISGYTITMNSTL
jgi:hypothetical protein